MSYGEELCNGIQLTLFCARYFLKGLGKKPKCLPKMQLFVKLPFFLR